MKSPGSRFFTLAIASSALMGFGVSTVAAIPAPAGALGSISVPAQQNPEQVATIDADAATTLTISKFLGILTFGAFFDAPVDGPSDGTAVEGIGLPPLSGVNFDVYEVQGIDLTTNEGWAAATALQDYTITQADIAAGTLSIEGATYELGEAVTVTTDESGAATFDGKVALYLVVENIGSSGEITKGGTGEVVENISITPSAPFLVTLPMTDPDSEAFWMYDVFAYPKNTSDSITKSVLDEGTIAGNDDHKAYSYQIDTSVTPGLSAKQVETYVVGDTLDSRVSLTGVVVAGADGTGLVESEDYTVYVDNAAWDGAATPGAAVQVVLTTSGIQKVIEGGGLTTTLEVTADSVGEDGIVLNDATLIPNASWWATNNTTDTPYDPETDNPEEGIPSNEVRTLYGALNVEKVDAASSETTLAGAEFLVTFDENGDAQCVEVDDKAAGIATAVTDENGQFSVTGLQTSNFYDGAEQESVNGYCLFETKAPEGYNLLAEGIYFTIDAAMGEANVFVPSAANLQVENVESNLGNDLPLTGGTGAAGLGLLGLLVAAGGVGYFVKRRREDVNEMSSSA